MQTNAGTHLLAYIPSRTSIARRVIARARPHMYMCTPSVYTFAVIGYRLYRVQQPYGAQPDSRECGLRYRNRAPSNPIPLHLILRFATAFFRFPPSFLVLPSVDAPFVQSTLFLCSLHQRNPETLMWLCRLFATDIRSLNHHSSTICSHSSPLSSFSFDPRKRRVHWLQRISVKVEPPRAISFHQLSFGILNFTLRRKMSSPFRRILR